jgi:hypothetical protein
MEILNLKYWKILTRISTILESDNEVKTVLEIVTNDILQQKKTSKKIRKTTDTTRKASCLQYFFF